jgi:hypothetical protein
MNKLVISEQEPYNVRTVVAYRHIVGVEKLLQHRKVTRLAFNDHGLLIKLQGLLIIRVDLPLASG